MSRGLGRVERLLLHAVYAHPQVVRTGDRFVTPSDFAETDSEYSSLQRAARSLLRKGLVTGYSTCLRPLPECPVVSVQKCSDWVFCEHIKAVILRETEKYEAMMRSLDEAHREYEKRKNARHLGGESA